jgi:hypothetical protein
VLDACRRWHPDVIMHESCEFAAVLAAELTGVPRVRVAIGTWRYGAGHPARGGRGA